VVFPIRGWFLAHATSIVDDGSLRADDVEVEAPHDGREALRLALLSLSSCCFSVGKAG